MGYRKGNASESYYIGARSECRSEHRLFFRGFLRSVQSNSGITHPLSHDHFLPNPFKLIYHPNIQNYSIL
jgi:hypothetical protein